MKPWKMFGVGVVSAGLLSTSVLAQSPSLGSRYASPVSSAPQGPASAAPPSFTYQGQLKQAGVPVNGACDFAFSLYDDATAGTDLGDLIITSTNVVNGLFVVNLTYSTSLFDGNPRWLAISPRCPAGSGSYSLLTPRQAINNVPAAYSLIPGAVISGSAQNVLTAVATTGNVGNPAALHGVASGAANLNSQAPPVGVWGESHSGIGVLGDSDSFVGVYGYSNSPTSAGVYGQNDSGGDGVLGTATLGNGVNGTSSSSTGVRAASTSGIGLWASSSSGNGESASSYSGYGLDAHSTSGTGVRAVVGGYSPAVVAITSQSDGVVATSYYSNGVTAASSSGYGVRADSSSNDAVYAHSTSGSGVHAVVGGYAPAIMAVTSQSDGVVASSYYSNGVTAASSSGYGVRADSSSNDAVYAHSSSGNGISAVSSTGTGLSARSSSATNSAILARNDGNGMGDAIDAYATGNGWGISSNAISGTAVYGSSISDHGVFAESRSSTRAAALVTNWSSGDGLDADSSNGIGLYASSNNIGVETYNITSFTDARLATLGYAGDFAGNVRIVGNLSTTGAKNFIMDDPLDPANKTLKHAAIESPNVLNFYNGSVTLDAKGEATVQLPDYFNAINKDYQYQLTSIGAPGPNLYIAEKITGNHFRIAGGVPGAEVSWQVTGVRNDPWAAQHPYQPVENKPAAERGSYLYPQGYGQPVTATIQMALYGK